VAEPTIEPVRHDIAPVTDGEVQWFALWTRSRHEQVVREQLEQKHI
jgi:hypothetical protein